jgi:hypothetical protein
VATALVGGTIIDGRGGPPIAGDLAQLRAGYAKLTARLWVERRLER